MNRHLLSALMILGLAAVAWATTHGVHAVVNGYAPHAKSPDGSCWEIEVDNAGALSATACLATPSHCDVTP